MQKSSILISEDEKESLLLINQYPKSRTLHLYQSKQQQPCCKPVEPRLTSLKTEVMICRKIPNIVLRTIFLGLLYLMYFLAFSIVYGLLRLIGMLISKRYELNVFDEFLINILNQLQSFADTTPETKNAVDKYFFQAMFALELIIFLCIAVKVSISRKCAYSDVQLAIMRDDISTLFENHFDLLRHNRNIEVKAIFYLQPQLYSVMQVVTTCKANKTTKLMNYFASLDSKFESYANILNSNYRSLHKPSKHLPIEIIRIIFSYLSIDDVCGQLKIENAVLFSCFILWVDDALNQEAGKKFNTMWNELNKETLTESLTIQYDQYTTQRHKLIECKTRAETSDNDIEKQLPALVI